MQPTGPAGDGSYRSGQFVCRPKGTSGDDLMGDAPGSALLTVSPQYVRQLTL
jgi:hypothetical protein